MEAEGKNKDSYTKEQDFVIEGLKAKLEKQMYENEELRIFYSGEMK